MKKIFLLLLVVPFVIIFSGAVFAEEMVVHLKSGNAVVIQYTGTIQGVTLRGQTDAIAGMNIQTTDSDTIQKPQSAGQARAATGKSEKAPSKWLRLRWADPKQED